jgi:hypothetical protein
MTAWLCRVVARLRVRHRGRQRYEDDTQEAREPHTIEPSKQRTIG